jgi:hypothetical protein
MASVWERVGEAVGYGLAAVVLGPHAAAKRRTRRMLRAAFRGWSDAHHPVAMLSGDGTLRRRVTLAGTMGPLPVEAEVDPYMNTAKLVVAAQLPPLAQVSISRWPASRRQDESASATMDGTQAFSKTLPADVCRALLELIHRGPIGALETFDIDVSPDHVEVAIAAPHTADDWRLASTGALALVTWLDEKWPPGYRS